MADYVPATLNSLVGGALADRFQQVFEQVLYDIADPSKSAEETREITIRLKIRPDDSRQSCLIEADATAKLGRSKPEKSFMLISITEDGPIAKVSSAKQMTLQEQLEAKSKREA